MPVSISPRPLHWVPTSDVCPLLATLKAVRHVSRDLRAGVAPHSPMEPGPRRCGLHGLALSFPLLPSDVERRSMAPKWEETFQDQDWRTLQFSSMWVFVGVAGVDGKISKKERKRFFKLLSDSPSLRGELVREVMMSVFMDLEGVFKEIGRASCRERV